MAGPEDEVDDKLWFLGRLLPRGPGGLKRREWGYICPRLGPGASRTPALQPRLSSLCPGRPCSRSPLCPCSSGLGAAERPELVFAVRSRHHGPSRGRRGPGPHRLPLLFPPRAGPRERAQQEPQPGPLQPGARLPLRAAAARALCARHAGQGAGAEAAELGGRDGVHHVQARWAPRPHLPAASRGTGRGSRGAARDSPACRLTRAWGEARGVGRGPSLGTPLRALLWAASHPTAGASGSSWEGEDDGPPRARSPSPGHTAEPSRAPPVCGAGHPGSVCHCEISTT